jgi:Ion transport protein
MLYAFLVLFATALVCPLFILNMFPAIFIISLKRREETQRRLDWLAHFPGNKETVTELELFIWANNNQQIFFRLENAPSVNILTQMINACFRCCQYVGIASKTPPPKPTKKLEIAANTNNIKAKQDDHMLLQNNGEEEEDTVFLGAEEDDPDFGKGKLCVPKCRSIAALRSLLTAESSPFSQFINIIIVLNILNLAADAASTPPLGRVVVRGINYAFISIFMLEVVVKICILGPCLYLDSPFNLVDFTLVILSIPTFFDPSFQVLGVLRIFRLARLARSGQITRLYNQLNTAGAQKALKTPITLGRLSAMIFDLFTPMLNNVLMVVVLIYIYALVGMQFFAKFHADPYTLPAFSLKYQNPLSIPGNATAVEVAGIFSAGQYLSRMNFNCFGNAVVTVYNLGLLNGWYLFMINTVHRTQRQGVIWYFFSYVYIVVFLLGSALIASVASVLDGHAKAMIRDIAGSNKSIVDRYVILSRRERLRVWFKKLKKNTIESGVNTSLIGGKSKLKREAVAEYTGPPPVEPFLKKFLRERADYSLYLLSRQNIIRRGLKYLIESIFFQLIITFSILVSVIGLVVSEDRLMGPVNESLFLVVIFLSEMVLLWLVYGLIGSPNAYFNQPLYLIDFFVNAAMMYAYYTDFAVLNQLRLFRMLKVPSLMLYLTDSNTMRIFFVMIYNALPSLVSVLCMTLGTTFLTAVVGVQLYTGKFNHCSYKDYPGARSRFERDPVNFPTGCSGTGYTNVNTSVPFDPVTGYGLGSVLTGLHWQARLDNFDSIFTACKSTLRVLMSNEWQGILFSSLDIVGVDFEPSVNYQRSTGGGSFIFYFIISTLGITIGALYVSIFYYHIVITCILSGRKSLIGRQDAMWALYEEKLILVKRSLPVAKHTWAGLAQFYRRFEVKFIIIAYCVIPIVLLIGFYKDERYSDKTLTFYDTIFSILYVAEYIFRGMSDFTLKDGLAKLYKRTNKQEVGVVIFLIVCVLINVRTLSSGNKIIINTGKLRDIEFVCASAVVRVYRLAILFPNALLLLGVMQHSLGGFISLCIYGLIVIMIYGLLGFDVMYRMRPTYGSPFLNDALNFRSVTNSFFTLIAMGTGNYYSEVLDNMKQESKNSLGIQIFMEIYFLSFYLLFFLTLKSFAIQIIIRYESTFGSTIGIAGEQVTSFRHGWKSAGLFQNVKYEKLASLLGNHIPPPLGLAGTDPRYLELTRFVKKVLMCMPADSKRCLDGDKTGKLTRTMFKPENIPGDIR